MSTTFSRRLMLWKLLATATEPLSIAEIGQRLGVSKNTAQRDLDALSEAGVSVVEERRGQRLYFKVSAAGWIAPAGSKATPRGARRR